MVWSESYRIWSSHSLWNWRNRRNEQCQGESSYDRRRLCFFWLFCLDRLPSNWGNLTSQRQAIYNDFHFFRMSNWSLEQSNLHITNNSFWLVLPTPFYSSYSFCWPPWYCWESTPEPDPSESFHPPLGSLDNQRSHSCLGSGIHRSKCSLTEIMRSRSTISDRNCY